MTPTNRVRQAASSARAWHTAAMSIIRAAVVEAAEAAAPRGDYLRVRFRISLDMILTFGIAILAIGLIVGYQVLSRINPARFEGPR